jgi:hypothetical protein
MAGRRLTVGPELPTDVDAAPRGAQVQANEGPGMDEGARPRWWSRPGGIGWWSVPPGG